MAEIRVNWTLLSDPQLTCNQKKSRSGHTFFSQGLNLVWEPGSLQLIKVSKCKSSLTNTSAEKNNSSTSIPVQNVSLPKSQATDFQVSATFLLLLLFYYYFGLWTIARKSKNKESLLAVLLREGFLTSCVWAPCWMEMLVWKKLLLFSSQRMNENGNSALNRVLSSILPLERSKTNFTA